MRRRHYDDDDPDDDDPPDTTDATTKNDMADLRDADWYQFIVDIDNLLATGRFTWAEATLRDIQRTVTANRSVTPKQRAAVQHIEDSRLLNLRRRHRG